jgi:hypothetical protein
MRFGTRVIVTRGCNSCGSGVCANNLREVPGKLVGAKGNQSLVLLDYMDGPDDRQYFLKNNTMWFSKSQVSPASVNT